MCSRVPLTLSLSPGLRAGPAVRQRDLLRHQPLAAGAADVHPPGTGGGRVPPLQPQGTGVGDKDRVKGTELWNGDGGWCQGAGVGLG